MVLSNGIKYPIENSSTNKTSRYITLKSVILEVTIQPNSSYLSKTQLKWHYFLKKSFKIIFVNIRAPVSFMCPQDEKY